MSCALTLNVNKFEINRLYPQLFGFNYLWLVAGIAERNISSIIIATVDFENFDSYTKKVT